MRKKDKRENPRAGVAVDIRLSIRLLPTALHLLSALRGRLFGLCAAILEPNLHLSLRKTQFDRQFAPRLPDQVRILLEFVLESAQLAVGEGRAGPFGTIQVEAFGEKKLPHTPVTRCNRRRRIRRRGKGENSPVISIT